MSDSRDYRFAIHKFWTDFKTNPNDAAQLIPIDMIAYGPLGGGDKTIVPATVSSLLDRLQDIGSAGNNIAVQMAHARADFIRPRYEAWKKGQEVPLNGTPLAAWNGVTLEEATILRTAGFKTVEDVAGMTEGHITSIKLPSLRQKKKQAEHFIASADQTRVAAQLAEKDEQVAALKAENADRDEQIRALMEKVNALAELAAGKATLDEGDGSPLDVQQGIVPAPPKRGRPRKDQQSAAA